MWWHIPLTHDRSLHLAVLREVPHVLQEHWPGLVWGPQGEDFVALRVRDSQPYHPTTGKPPTEFPWYQQAYSRMLESRGRSVLYGAPPDSRLLSSRALAVQTQRTVLEQSFLVPGPVPSCWNRRWPLGLLRVSVFASRHKESDCHLVAEETETWGSLEQFLGPCTEAAGLSNLIFSPSARGPLTELGNRAAYKG